MANIKYTVNGTYGPFMLFLKKNSVNGETVKGVFLQADQSGIEQQFTNIQVGTYVIIVYDTSNGMDVSSILSVTTTTTTTTTLAPTTTHTTTTHTTTTHTTTTTTTAAPITYFVYGNGGKINKTLNNGLTWSNVSLTTTDILDGGSVVGNTGYFFSNDKLFKTTNGGSSYSTITLPANIVSIYAINANNLIFGTYAGNNFYYISNNGGSTFTTLTKTNIFDMNMDIFEFVNASLGFSVNHFPIIGGGPVIAKTTNGGISWTNITAAAMNTSYTYNGISFNGSGIGYIVGSHLFKSVNNGTSWTELTLPFPNLSNVKVFNSNVVIVSGTDDSSNNVIARSTNGGANWTLTTIPFSSNGVIIGGPTNGMVFFDDNHGVIPLYDGGGLTKTLYTNDNGVTWNFGGNTTLVYPNYLHGITASRTGF